jgi:hypothetical protein
MSRRAEVVLAAASLAEERRQEALRRWQLPRAATAERDLVASSL